MTIVVVLQTGPVFVEVQKPYSFCMPEPLTGDSLVIGVK